MGTQMNKHVELLKEIQRMIATLTEEDRVRILARISVGKQVIVSEECLLDQQTSL